MDKSVPFKDVQPKDAIADTTDLNEISCRCTYLTKFVETDRLVGKYFQE